MRNELLWFALSLLVYYLISLIQKSINNSLIKALMNPLLWSIIAIVSILQLSKTDFQTYYQGGQYIDIWLVPATIALALKLYKNLAILKRYFKEILWTILFGMVIHTVSIVVLALVFKLNYQMTATLFPKTITTALAINVAKALEGETALIVIFVILVGLLGSIAGPILFKIFKISNPYAQGVAMGFSSHAVGTSKAIEMGEVQGTISSVTMIVTGILFVVVSPVVGVVLRIVIG